MKMQVLSRIYVEGRGIVEKGKIIDLTEEQAKLQHIAGYVAPAEGQEEEPKKEIPKAGTEKPGAVPPIEEMDINDIKNGLNAMAVQYPPRASKETLYDLYKEAKGQK